MTNPDVPEGRDALLNIPDLTRMNQAAQAEGAARGLLAEYDDLALLLAGEKDWERVHKNAKGDWELIAFYRRKAHDVVQFLTAKGWIKP